MPNSISPEQLKALHIPELDRTIKLDRAGGILPDASGAACRAEVDDVVDCVLYAQIVVGKVKKFGTARSLRERMAGSGGNSVAINMVLAFQDGRSASQAQSIRDYAQGKADEFKKQAPEVIRSGQTIEVWAASLSSRAECQDLKKRYKGKCGACKKIEGTLNERYQTIRFGWAMRKN